MMYLEAGKTVEQLSISDEIKDGTALPVSVEPPQPSVQNEIGDATVTSPEVSNDIEEGSKTNNRRRRG